MLLFCISALVPDSTFSPNAPLSGHRFWSLLFYWTGVPKSSGLMDGHRGII